MYVKLGATIRGNFGTNAFADGSAVAADSTPTCVVLDQGTAMGYAPTVTSKATGLYEVVVVASSGNGFTVGHEYSAYVVVVIGGKTTRAPVHGITSFNVTTNDPDSSVTVGAYASTMVPGGQIKPNSIIDNYVYGSVGKPTSWRVRVFATKTATDAAVAGHADNADSETERFKGSASYNTDGSLLVYKIDRDLP